MRFVIDAQLPPGLGGHLAREGHIADHVNRVGLGGADDPEIWTYCRRTGAVLITKDDDFVALAQRDAAGPQIVWIRLGNIANDALWGALKAVLGEILEALKAGDRVVEVR
jgi:predicted nuclease of predicted toxin-antitoxin system